MPISPPSSLAGSGLHFQVDREHRLMFFDRREVWYSIANDLTVGDRELGLARKALNF